MLIIIITNFINKFFNETPLIGVRGTSRGNGMI